MQTAKADADAEFDAIAAMLSADELAEFNRLWEEGLHAEPGVTAELSSRPS